MDLFANQHTRIGACIDVTVPHDSGRDGFVEVPARGPAKQAPRPLDGQRQAPGLVQGVRIGRIVPVPRPMTKCRVDEFADTALGSKTYGHWHGEQLDQSSRAMICVSEGFAHGFQTLTDNVEMLYFHSHAYSAKDEGGLRWNDVDLRIPWPLAVTHMSTRDRGFPSMNELEPISA